MGLVAAEGLEADKAKAKLESAREGLNGTRVFWHQFELQALATELRKVTEDAQAAYEEARRVLIKR